MDLSAYQAKHSLTVAELARTCGVTVQALHRYMWRGRIPETAVLARILAATKGEVTPNDFFAIPIVGFPIPGDPVRGGARA